MNAEGERPPIVLQEQCYTTVWLGVEDAILLPKLGFDVRIDTSAPDPTAVVHGPDENRFIVNPRQYVAHLELPSGTVLLVKPKVDPANVFRMLAYVYAGWNREVFQRADVLYSTDKFLFEPLVELFCELVAARIRRGLVQNYMIHEEDLTVLRGRILFEQQVAVNARRPDRLFCRYQQQTLDNEDNQIVKWAIWYLSSLAGWSTRTAHSLRLNLGCFAEVSLRRPARGTLSARVYHRMNDDYRLLHDFCRLFIDNRAISEHAGDWQFRGFLLDMNVLFEAFVTMAFLKVARPTPFVVHPQKEDFLSEPESMPIRIRPDVIVHDATGTVAIVDAKYKRLNDSLGNSDFYQMLAYGTALQCSRAYLFYPASEWDEDAVIKVRHSPINIHVQRIDIGQPNCVLIAEQAARSVLNEAST